MVVCTLAWPSSSLTVSTGFANSRYGSPARDRPSFMSAASIRTAYECRIVCGVT
ncbi:Uncharacterised protein [Mycobacteroides abscessus subsp. abscessus]|nr:Uncharacterised protein [Mycobacteroides abscessus subsp. abscessus]